MPGRTRNLGEHFSKIYSVAQSALSMGGILTGLKQEADSILTQLAPINDITLKVLGNEVPEDSGEIGEIRDEASNQPYINEAGQEAMLSVTGKVREPLQAFRSKMPAEKTLLHSELNVIDSMIQQAESGLDMGLSLAKGILYSYHYSLVVDMDIPEDVKSADHMQKAMERYPADILLDGISDMMRLEMEYQQKMRRVSLSVREEQEYRERYIRQLDLIIDSAEMVQDMEPEDPDGLAVFHTKGQLINVTNSDRGIHQAIRMAKWFKEALNKGYSIDEMTFYSAMAMKEMQQGASLDQLMGLPETKDFAETKEKLKKYHEKRRELMAGGYPDDASFHKYLEAEKDAYDALKKIRKDKLTDTLSEELKNAVQKLLDNEKVNYSNAVIRGYNRSLSTIRDDIRKTKEPPQASVDLVRQGDVALQAVKVLEESDPWYHKNSQEYKDALSSLKEFQKAALTRDAGIAAQKREEAVRSIGEYLKGKDKTRSTELGEKRFNVFMTALAAMEGEERFAQRINGINRTRKGRNQLEALTYTTKAENLKEGAVKEIEKTYGKEECMDRASRNRGILRDRMEKKAMWKQEAAPINEMIAKINAQLVTEKKMKDKPIPTKEELLDIAAKNVYLETIESALYQERTKEHPVLPDQLKIALSSESIEKGIRDLKKEQAFQKAVEFYIRSGENSITVQDVNWVVTHGNVKNKFYEIKKAQLQKKEEPKAIKPVKEAGKTEVKKETARKK